VHPGAVKYEGALIDYLDQGRFQSALVIREQERHLAVVDSEGRERLVPRDLVMARYPEKHIEREHAAEAIEALRNERSELAKELDLELLWGVVSEQGRSFGASEMAELFFGRRSNVAASVMLEALLNDRIYFVRRHMEFVPRTPDQVERLRVQADRVRSRSDDYRRTQKIIRDVLSGSPPPADAEPLIEELTRYLKNRFTRSRELTQMLAQAVPEVDPADAAFAMLERLGAKPDVPRFALIAGLPTEFSAEAIEEAARAVPGPRPTVDGGYAITLDDSDTVEVDDALAIEPLGDGALRVRVHIALVADFVTKGGALDAEAAARATTVYLPETTVRMLPDVISCEAASLLAAHERPVLTTDVTLSAEGELLDSSIYPARIRIAERVDYDRANALLENETENGPAADTVRQLYDAALKLRENRRRAGAILTQRRESKVRVQEGNKIEIEILDSASPSRTLVAEFMVLSNFVAARYAAMNRVPIIYRVQPQSGLDYASQRPRLSLYPEYHAGIGLDYYAQLSSPIRRYADLVLQRQLLAALAGHGAPYNVDELLKVLAGAESAEDSGRELERRAKRYWTLRYLLENEMNRPLAAWVTRDGASAELVDYAVRGTLHGAPSLTNQSQVMVRVSRVDPLRGWLVFDYVGQAERPGETIHR
jgi:exoribonuclease II